MDIEYKSLGIIIVTYNPNMKELKENINAYYNSARIIVIVDNSETNIDFEGIILSRNIVVKKLKKNMGIAYAQNAGIQLLMDIDEINYIMFFDQDSSLTSPEINRLFRFFNQPNIGLVGPTLREKPLKGSVSETLSSGSIIPKEVLQIVGYMNSQLFIDFVDYEWCWRAKSKGYRIIVDDTTFLNHKLGEGKVLGIGIPVPIRHYYQFRNFVYLSKCDAMPIKFKFKYSFIYIAKAILYPVLLDEKKTRMKYICRGILDGFKGIMGQYNEQ